MGIVAAKDTDARNIPYNGIVGKSGGFYSGQVPQAGRGSVQLLASVSKPLGL